MTHSKKGAGGVAREERRTKATELRKEKLTYKQIADILGVHESTVSRDLDKRIELWRDRSVDAVEVYRSSEVDEMNRVRAKAWEAIEACPVGKMAPLLGQVVNAGARVAKLHGLDAPEHVILEGRMDVMTDDEAREALEKAGIDWRAL